MMLNDCMYGIIFRDINMQRTFVDQHFSRMIHSLAGIIINLLLLGDFYDIALRDFGLLDPDAFLLSDLLEEERSLDPILGGEDFAFYQQRIPGCFAMIGISQSDWQTRYSVHHPKFIVDEAALPIGAALHVAMALESLGH